MLCCTAGRLAVRHAQPVTDRNDACVRDFPQVHKVYLLVFLGTVGGRIAGT